MNQETMTDPRELSHEIWFDENSQTIFMNLDRVSIALSLDEFFEVLDRMEESRENLVSNFNIVVGTYTSEKDGKERKSPVIVSDDDEYH